MVDSLKTFNEGEHIYASETNSNNQYLLSKLSDNAAQLQTFVEGEISSIQSNVASVQATLQANIDSANTNANSKLSASISKSANGYCKFSNGLIVQWGKITDEFSGEKTVTLPTAFTTTNYSVVAGLYLKGDFTANWSTYSYTKTNFKINNESSGKKIYTWVAIGY